MNIVNVMWAGGSAYASVHKVHQLILSQAEENSSISTWLLQGDGCCSSLGNVLEWNLSHRVLKGRHLWKLAQPLLRARMRAALLDNDTQVLLLDGIGVARLMLPLLRTLPNARATVLFHGSTKLRDSDVKLLRGIPPQHLQLIAVSSTLACALQSALGRPVQALRIAMDPQAFRTNLQSVAQARQSIGLASHAGRVLGAVGRLVESKGFDFLLDAFASACAREPDLNLVILGEGELRPHLEARIQSLGLSERVLMPGHLKNLAQLYRAFDCLLVPSRSEGLGLVVQEAVLADVPVLCSDLPVFREQLGNVACYLPVGDVQAWSRAIGQCQKQALQALAQAQQGALAPAVSWEAFRRGTAGMLAGLDQPPSNECSSSARGN